MLSKRVAFGQQFQGVRMPLMMHLGHGAWLAISVGLNRESLVHSRLTIDFKDRSRKNPLTQKDRSKNLPRPLADLLPVFSSSLAAAFPASASPASASAKARFVLP